MTRSTLLVFVALASFAARAHAQSAPAATPRATAALRAAPVEIDGVATEEAWAAATPVTGFVQGLPVEGAPVDQPTEVLVLYDDRSLYVAARMYDEAPHSISRQRVRRDEDGQYDYFEVSLDPNSDRRTGYVFRVSAAGVQTDTYLFNDVTEDRTWNAVWESAVRHDSAGWTVEIRIPLSQVRYQASPGPQSWGVNFTRHRVATNERSFFALESRARHGRVSAFGRLDGLLLDRSAQRLELRPYLLANTETAPVTPGDPFGSDRERSVAAGLDLRYGLGSAFTLDATLNPDFGQVEVDPAVINLTAFETFYPEQRPFFVEDAQIFHFPLSGPDHSLFYSRRVGRAPHRTRIEDADFVEVDPQSSILGAAKLTGRTEGGLSLGALAAVTAEEAGRAAFLDTDSLVSFRAEPRSQFGVMRAQQDFRDGNSQIGGIVTGVNRELGEDGAFDFLPDQVLTLGTDFEHTWADRVWRIWGFFAGSHVRGSPTAIVRIQESSNHYFQRPDADYLAVDSTATSMSGVEWRLQFDRLSGRHWTGGVWASQRTPGLDVNDLGYFRTGERLDLGTRWAYQDITPGSVLRDYRLTLSSIQHYRTNVFQNIWSARQWGHAHKNGNLTARAEGTFLNYWTANVGAIYRPEVLVEESTRGGPLMRRPAGFTLDATWSTDPRARVSIAPWVETQLSDAGEVTVSTRLGVAVRPTSWLQLQMDPSYSREEVAAQYVTTTDVLPYEPTYGRRYLFAALERETVSLDTRLNATFSPYLTLQLFLQPLLSVGDFSGYKQLVAPETFAFEVFEEGASGASDGQTACLAGRTCSDGDNRYVDLDGDGAVDLSFAEQDFRIRSLRGNAVLRWEYRPGSTLFLVWQQERAYRDALAAQFDLLGESADLLGDPPRNVFIVKVNYWLSR